jgi:hypothetical protein
MKYGSFMKLDTGNGSMRVMLADIEDVQPFAPNPIAANPAKTGATIVLKDGRSIDTESSIADLLKHVKIVRRKA